MKEFEECGKYSGAVNNVSMLLPGNTGTAAIMFCIYN